MTIQDEFLLLKIDVRRFFAAAKNAVTALSAKNRRIASKNARARRQGLALLRAASRPSAAPAVAGTVLVDAAWDNANYWIRYSLLRAALNLAQADEIGVLGPFQRQRALGALDAFEIASIRDAALSRSQIRAQLPHARALLAGISLPDDIMRLQLPHAFPAAMLYDGILKRQRTGSVDTGDPMLPYYVAEALAALERAAEILSKTNPTLVVLSHGTNFHFGSFAWLAARRGAKVILLQGDAGSLRAIQFRNPGDIFNSIARPLSVDAAALDISQTQALARAGREYLGHRMGGRATDVGSIYAYNKRTADVTKAEIASRYGWHADAPVILVMAPNWFDYPHGFGDLEYRDFIDWMEEVVAAAREVTGVNWLFKSHPCDDWYGVINGKKLSDMVPRDRANAMLADKSWNGTSLLKAVDGVITFHGNGGVEAASLGKPVLLPYLGWYGHFGFAKVAKTRALYRSILREAWWREAMPDAAKLAHTFAGWLYCVPDWHRNYTFRDDSNQDAIWWDLDLFLSNNAAEMAREIEMLRAWFLSDAPFYNVFKMRLASDYLPPLGQIADKSVVEDPRKLQFSAVDQDVGP